MSQDEQHEIDIRHLKLVSGDEIIATIIENDECDYLILARPIKIHFSISPDGDAYSMFSRWNMFSDLNEPSFVNPEHVVSFSACSEETINKYLAIVNDDDDQDQSLVEDSDFTRTTINDDKSDTSKQSKNYKKKIVLH